MCGIIGISSNKSVSASIISSLKKLEYRGYDSAGIATLFEGEIKEVKSEGRVDTLEQNFDLKNLKGNIGIGHVRWATHGVPNSVNAHPHSSDNVSVVHNGIIENYSTIKQKLIKEGFSFDSETDTEVLVNLIEYVKDKNSVKLGEAVQIALNQVVGAYAIAVINNEKPDEIVVAKLGSPLVIGIENNNFYIGSDPSPFIKYTNRCLYLGDNEMAILNKKKGITLRSLQTDNILKPKLEKSNTLRENEYILIIRNSY